MAWSNSKIFRPFLADVLGNVAAFDLDTDALKVALYDNDITPDSNASSANSAYNADQWTSLNNEVFQGGQWAQGGVALANQVLSSAVADTVFLDANNTSSGTSATLSNVYGCLVYDDTLAAPVADQGICFNYFGGTNSVVSGTLTIVWNTNGILRYTHT